MVLVSIFHLCSFWSLNFRRRKNNGFRPWSRTRFSPLWETKTTITTKLIKVKIQPTKTKFHQKYKSESENIFLLQKNNLCKYWWVSSPLVMAPRKREASNPRPLTFSIVTDERLDELLMITILAPVLAIFSTKKKQYIT